MGAATESAEGAATALPPEDGFTDLARAKVNLFLHVLGRRSDGRHNLESLAVFPDLGDVLTAEASAVRSLSLDGPFAPDLDVDADKNLVLKAVEAFALALGETRGVALRLEKRLPVASGVGGGSADAAAALRLLARVWGRTLDAEALQRLALSLGADVPVCLASAPALMGGVGERLAPAPAFPGFWLVLANPLRAVSTVEVFARLERRENPASGPAPNGFPDLDALVAWLEGRRNDLERPARGLAPAVDAVLDALGRSPSCRLARMSGSGATCFGVFATEAEAVESAAEIRRGEPGWWVAPGRVKPWSGASTFEA